MSRIVSKANPVLRHTVHELRRAARAHDAPIWATVADRLERPRHAGKPVNVGHLQRLAAEQEAVVVAGKLLAAGPLTKPLTVGAFSFSVEARSKIRAAGGTALTIAELLKAHPDGAGVRIIA